MLIGHSHKFMVVDGIGQELYGFGVLFGIFHLIASRFLQDSLQQVIFGVQQYKIDQC